MDKLSITVNERKDLFAPGEIISGTVAWDLSESMPFLTLQLFWYTSGKGTRDHGIVEEKRIENPLVSGSEPFSFRLPRQPLSFSGTLISLHWVLELKTAKENEAEQFHFRLGLTDQELILPMIDDPDQPLKKWKRR